MRHPFDLEIKDLESSGIQPQDLEFEELISPAEAEAVAGGRLVTTQALGEEGGSPWVPHLKPGPRPRPIYLYKPPIEPADPPMFTSMAIGEEGGDGPMPIL